MEWRWLVWNRLAVVAVLASVVVAGDSGCAQAPTAPRKAARLTIDGVTHTTQPPVCSQEQSYRTIDIRDRTGQVQATVLLSGTIAIPEWVKIRNVDGFTGSFWEGGVGEAHVDLVRNTYIISGSASGISRSGPDKAVTIDFKIVADC